MGTREVTLNGSRWAAQACGAVAALLGALALTGWLTGWRLLSSFRPDYIPMAPNTALSFLVLSAGLGALTLRGRWAYRLAKAGAAARLSGRRLPAQRVCHGRGPASGPVGLPIPC